MSQFIIGSHQSRLETPMISLGKSFSIPISCEDNRFGVSNQKHIEGFFLSFIFESRNVIILITSELTSPL